MGVFDQAARFAAQAGPNALVARLLKGKGLALQFRAWMDSRSLPLPLPGRPERTADLIAALDEPMGQHLWLLVLEFQAQIDPDKLDVTLEEVGILRSRARHGPERQGKYMVTAGLVYLQGTCPEAVLDMTLPDGTGTHHAPLLWNGKALAQNAFRFHRPRPQPSRAAARSAGSSGRGGGNGRLIVTLTPNSRPGLRP